jgi:hypothetical protein
MEKGKIFPLLAAAAVYHVQQKDVNRSSANCLPEYGKIKPAKNFDSARRGGYYYEHLFSSEVEKAGGWHL